MDYTSGDNVRIIYFCTADGVNIIPTLTTIIDVIRRHVCPKQEIEIEIIYNDHEGNDFNALFKTINNFNGNTSLLANGRSMYTKVVPKSSVDFITCVTAGHWLSKSVTITNGISQCEANEEELLALKDQAHKDLMHFWVTRTTEMKTGGILFMSCPVTNKNEDEAFGRPRLVMIEVLRELKNGGYITKDELTNINFGFYLRTTE